MQSNQYVTKSLELHLFFGRIMKEHSFFLEAGFTTANAAFIKQADLYKKEFERLLCQAIKLGDGNIREKVLSSGELVTEFTMIAEKQTQGVTGIPIPIEITKNESRLSSLASSCGSDPKKYAQVKAMNQTAIHLLDGLISFKETILQNILCCNMFTMNYPLLIEHILREAKLYRQYVQMLEKEGDLSCQSMKEIECFWNQILMEHALFIRGLLDPTEAELFQSADNFADEYAKLLEACSCAYNQTLASESLEETIRFRDFKEAGTEGITQCKIRSIILPLLADHVLREANHYIRLLED